MVWARRTLTDQGVKSLVEDSNIFVRVDREGEAVSLVVSIIRVGELVIQACPGFLHEAHHVEQVDPAEGGLLAFEHAD